MTSRLQPASTPDSTVMVEFDGEGSGVEDLTWGQRGLWHVMAEKRTWLPIGAVLPLPAATTLDDAVADLRFAMSRYPSMRTKLRFDPDGPRQVLSTSGEVPLEIVDVAEDADPDEVAKQVERRYRTTDYDFVREWPVRMAVIRHRGVLTHRVWIMCHLVTDGTGAEVILAELAGRAAGGAVAGGAVAGGAAMPPLEQARWQRSPAGQRQGEASLRHWEKVLRRVPPRRFPELIAAPGPRYWQARFESPATHQAVRVIGARTGVETASVLMAVFAVALARVTSIDPVLVQVLVSNRFRPGLARTVSPIMQNGLCAIEVPDSTIDDIVRGAKRSAMTAYKYAYYDPARRDELVARISRERGEPVDIECYYNDRRLRQRDAAGPVPTGEQVRAALPRSTFLWQHKQDAQQFDSLFVNVDDVPDTVALTVLTDTHRVSPVDVEACVRGTEEVAVAAALDPATRTRVSRDVAPRGTGSTFRS